MKPNDQIDLFRRSKGEGCQHHSATRGGNSSISAKVRLAPLLVMVSALIGCVSTQRQPDGSTKVHLSLGIPTNGAHDGTQPPSALVVKPADQAKPDRQALFNVPSIRASALSGVFSKHPYDGSTRSYFPRVAVTVTEWTGNDCWAASATIWWSKSKSEAVPAFSVCWGKSVGYAVNNAANLHLFMQQTAMEHSGNVRSTGPKPPMLAIPDRQPISERQQLAFQGFIQQLILDTGWQPGAPTNLWLVGYDTGAANATEVSSSTNKGTLQPMDARAKDILEQALACSSIGRRFDLAESSLKKLGWRSGQGVTPITLPEPIKIFGLSARKIAVSRGGGEQIYRSYLAGASLPQLIKSASLKLGKDGRTYGRVTKVGVLSADMEGGETTLSCTVDTEGSEG